MEFRLDEEQQALQDTVRHFCAARFCAEKIAERCGRGVDRAAWREMAGLGLLGVLGAEGLGAVEAAIVFEQLGAHLVNGPALWTPWPSSGVARTASARPTPTWPRP